MGNHRGLILHGLSMGSPAPIFAYLFQLLLDWIKMGVVRDVIYLAVITYRILHPNCLA